VLTVSDEAMTRNEGGIFIVAGYPPRQGERFGLAVRDPATVRPVYFQRSWEKVWIKLERNGALIEVPLRSLFWTTCPDLWNDATQDWLFRSRLAPWEPRPCPHFIMRCMGGPRFEILHVKSKDPFDPNWRKWL
jgi:hypothetical protein